MATLTQDHGIRGDTWRIGFELDGKSRTIRIGAMPEKAAELFRDHVGTLAACVASNSLHLIPDKLLTWAAGLSAGHYEKLVKAGLLPARESNTGSAATLRELVDAVKGELGSKKPLTQENYARIFALILERFGDARAVVTISPQDADAFIVWLRTEKKLGPATVARRVKAYRLLFKRALRWRMTSENPFEGIKAGASINHARKAFVPHPDVEKLIEGTADREFRCVLALSRYGALRTPSETVLLKWSDIDWTGGKMLVHSPKTEGHAGGESRMVPLFPRLAEILLDHHSNLPEGASEFVIGERSAAKNFRTRLTKLIAKCGVKPWPKLFHNLRASRESELCGEYPLTTVCQWLGHRPEVAAAHYLVDPDKDGSFRQAAGLDAGRKATQNPTRRGVNSTVFEGIRENAHLEKPQQNQAFTGVSENKSRAHQDSNLKPSA